jgi:hypothetical protein
MFAGGWRSQRKKKARKPFLNRRRCRGTGPNVGPNSVRPECTANALTSSQAMRGIPKILLQRLSKPNQPNRQSTLDDRQPEHLDANLLAAFVERTLTERERKEVLNHLAQCAGCRDLLALALPSEVEVGAPARSTARWGWNLWPALRWSVVAAAVGIVAMVAILRFHQRTKLNAISRELRSAVAANSGRATPQPAAGLSAPGSLKNTVSKMVAESPESPPVRTRRMAPAAPPPGKPVSVHPTDAELRRPVTLTAAARTPAPQANVPARTGSVTVTAGLSSDMAARASAPLNAPQAPSPASSERRGVIQGASAASMYARSASVAAKSASPVARSPQARPAIMALRAELQNAATQPAALWTIAPDGKPQRSFDGGKTWQDVHIDDKIVFRVIEATGGDVWAAGSSGALYHSSDGGGIWIRVNLSSGGSPTTDAIVSVVRSPSDPQRITVKSATGEQWTSEDGGQHWRAVTSDE